MPKIADLPEFENLTGAETVLIEREEETGRARLGDYLDALGFGQMKVDIGALGQGLSVEQQARAQAVAAEALQREAADLAEAQARAQGIAGEAALREQGLTAEALSRVQADSAEEQARIQADLGEEQARIQGDQAEAQARAQGDADEALARQQADEAESLSRRQAAALAAARLPQPQSFVKGRVHIHASDGRQTLDGTDLITGRRQIANLALPGHDAIILGGYVPLITDARGRVSVRYSMKSRRIELPGAPVGLMTDPPRQGWWPTEFDGAGRAVAGWEPGGHVRLAPLHANGRVLRQGDDNQVPQLFYLVEGANRTTLARVQLTYSQHGITGFETVRRATVTMPGLLRIETNDHDAISNTRHAVRYAHLHKVPPVSDLPTILEYLGVAGQSNSVAAGSYGTNPTGVTGPQTIRTPPVLRKGPFRALNLTWNTGTIPHQGNLDGDVVVAGGGYARDVPIDPARINSLVPIREGLGQDGAHEKGGWTRESYCSALAIHLNGPWGWNGARYVACASFGFGSSKFAELFWDGATRRQPYLNFLASVTRAKEIADANGLQLRVNMLIEQGEADWTNATWGDQLLAFIPIAQADIVAISGQANAPQVFLAQTVQAAGSLRQPALSGLAQMEIAASHADVHILPPGYICDFDGDAIHYKASDETWRGAIAADVMNDWFQRGQDAALHMTTATWLGSQVKVDFTHSFIFDTETVQMTAVDGGASIKNLNGATPTISRVRRDPANPRRLLIDLASALPADAVVEVRMGYGNQTTTNPPSQGYAGGQRTIFRRSDWERFSLIDGRPLPIFANIQVITATQES
ncbi:hypothetical protein [Sphingobium abikonense]|uniref:hypothetical protein n=1 Tax=Sphingobium abikonense TaxID=86193 RepID=UPI0007897BDE|nr:hypothetical protein [Sphingobium abikonense]